MALNGTNGTAIFIVLAGSVLAYSGLKGKNISAVTRDLIAGKNPADTATAPASAILGPTGPDNNPTISALPASAASNRTMIIQGLRSIGASNWTIAGMLGNFRVESGLSNISQNVGEHAIGFANWEGGRRIALQDYARAHNTVETDPRAQVGFMLQELTTVPEYKQAFAEAQASGNPTDAASIFDAKYEVSSGAARATRILYAVQEYMSLIGGGR
jgi:hypothetical protein